MAPVRRSARSSAPAGRICSAAGRALQTAFALEAVGDEVVFIVGPVLVTTLATQFSPYAALAAAGVLGLAGGIWLASLRASDPPGRGKSDGAEQAPLPWLSLMLLSLIGLGPRRDSRRR